jgi:iron(III) transport system ATP-binding protein
MAHLRIQDLSLRRASGFRLGPIDLELQAASATALIGPSGSGKTTLLRCIAGLERPDTGQVSLPAGAIGFVFQSGALWPHLTARQHLEFVAPRNPRAEHLALLASVGLEGKQDRLPASLSAGEGQRLALARALAPGPGLLLLDEPLHSVDLHLRDELALLVRRVARERKLTLIVVTHDRDEALAMADDFVVLRAGRIVETGPALSVLERPKTAYAAAFVGRAACLPVHDVDGGRVACAFGAWPRPAGNPCQLVLLPGDVEAVISGDGALPSATVLHVESSPTGILAAVELDGRTVRVVCEQRPAPGERLGLRLRRPPRLLPFGEPT